MGSQPPTQSLKEELAGWLKQPWVPVPGGCRSQASGSELTDGNLDAANALLPGGSRRVKLAQGTIFFSKKNPFFPHRVSSFLKPASLLSPRKSAHNYKAGKERFLEIFICS